MASPFWPENAIFAIFPPKHACHPCYAQLFVHRFPRAAFRSTAHKQRPSGAAPMPSHGGFLPLVVAALFVSTAMLGLASCTALVAGARALAQLSGSSSGGGGALLG